MTINYEFTIVSPSVYSDYIRYSTSENNFKNPTLELYDNESSSTVNSKEKFSFRMQLCPF